jgi:hypothetical protein
MPCPFHTRPDPFKHAREHAGVLVKNFQGNEVPMVLRHQDLRAAAKDWQALSSDARCGGGNLDRLGNARFPRRRRHLEGSRPRNLYQQAAR